MSTTGASTAGVPAPIPVPPPRAKTVDPREAQMSGLQASIQKQFGVESVHRYTDKTDRRPDVISSGSLAIDKALGIGGLPRGRIVEFYSQESVGKTSLAIQVCVEAEKLGGRVGYVDAEHAFDPAYAEALGLDLRYMLINQPDYGEQGLEIAEKMVEDGVDVIVVDSVAALTPKAELDGEMGDSHMGLQARLMGQAMRKLTAITSKSKSLIIFINQQRSKIGIVYGSPLVTTGGNALKFYASVRLELSRGQKITVDEKEIGCETKVKVIKNKMAAPHTVAECDMIYGRGFSKISDLINLGKVHNVIEASGAWMSFNGDKIGQGKENARAFLIANPEVARQIEYKIRAAIWPTTG